MAEPADRWSTYTDLVPTVASGWRFDVVTQPSRLGGSNGMTIGPDGRLYVTQVFFSQITAIDVETGEHAVFSPLGSGISGPDDAIFGADGTCFATEPMYGRVTARQPDGTYRVVAADLPAANGCTMDHARQRLFIDEFRPGGRLLEVDPNGAGPPRILLEDLDGPERPGDGARRQAVLPAGVRQPGLVLRPGDRRGPPRRRRPRPTDGGEVRLAGSPGDLGGRRRADHGRSTSPPAPARCSPRCRSGSTTCRSAPTTASSCPTTSTAGSPRRRPDASACCRRPVCSDPTGSPSTPTASLLFADGLSVGDVVDGEHHRRIRLLVDLPTLALGVVPVRRRARRDRRHRRGAQLRPHGRRADGAGRGPRRPDHGPRRRMSACWSPSAAPAGSAPSIATAACRRCSRTWRARRRSTCSTAATPSAPERRCC